jgi:hypothetical protein
MNVYIMKQAVAPNPTCLRNLLSEVLQDFFVAFDKRDCS